MKMRNTYLEKQIRTKYVPNGVFREANTYLVRTSVNTYQVPIRTKYVPNTYCVFPFSLRIYVLKWVKNALLIFLWASETPQFRTVRPQT